MKQLVFALIILVFISCNKTQEPKYYELQGRVFGTTYAIIYDGNENYEKPINELFKEFNNSLSTYAPNSIISRVNKNDSTVVVDEYFIESFNIAKKLYKETNGYFDPTIGKLINAYGFGSGKEKKNLSEEEITLLMNTTGFDKIELKNNKVYKDENIEFNVNAFAKGQGIDVVGRFLESKKVTNYLVEIGGEIRARGKNSRNLFWKVAIDDPNTDGTRSQSRFVELKNQSMATSGNYRKFKVNENGEKVVHTVNPKTGLAQESNLLSVSVMLEGDCADADAYATAFLAMGLEKTKSFIKERKDIKVVLIFIDENGNVSEYKN